MEVHAEVCPKTGHRRDCPRKDVFRQLSTHQSDFAIGARGTTLDYMLNVRNPSWSQPVLLEIKVRSNDDDTFETKLCCALSQCGKTVDIDSDGPKAIQNVSCPKHGFLTSFPHRVALGDYMRYLANQVLEKNGQRLIDAEAAFIVGDEQPQPESMN